MKIRKIIVIIAIAILSFGAAIESGEVRRRTNEEEYYLGQIRAVSEYSGIKYLGEFDLYAISRSTGKDYDGIAITQALLKAAGEPEDSITLRTTVGTYGELDLEKLTIFREEYEGQPLYDRKIVAEYLYTSV